MMRKEVDFLITSQVVPREENGCILLREELRRRGYTAEYLRYPRGYWRKYKNNVKVLIKNGQFSTDWLMARDTYSVVGAIEKCVSRRE